MPKPPSTLTTSMFSNLSDVLFLEEGAEWVKNVDHLSDADWAKTYYITGVSSLVGSQPSQPEARRRGARQRPTAPPESPVPALRPPLTPGVDPLWHR